MRAALRPLALCLFIDPLASPSDLTPSHSKQPDLFLTYCSQSARRSSSSSSSPSNEGMRGYHCNPPPSLLPSDEAIFHTYLLCVAVCLSTLDSLYTPPGFYQSTCCSNSCFQFLLPPPPPPLLLSPVFHCATPPSTSCQCIPHMQHMCICIEF